MMKDIIKEIEITKRNVSDKVQPLFAVGARFNVVHVECSADDKTTLIVQHPTRSGKTLRCSAERFAWRTVEPEAQKAPTIAPMPKVQRRTLRLAYCRA